MQTWKAAGLAAALVVGLGLVTTLPGQAQGPKKTDLSVGFVDLGLVTEQIKQTDSWRNELKKFEDTKARLRDEIDGLTKVRYLTKAEREEYKNLRAKPKASDSEKERIGKLERKSEDMDQEYMQLGQTEKLSDQQIARVKELKDVRERALAELQTEAENRAQQLQGIEAGVLDTLQKKVLQAVEKVSQNKGLGIVFDRSTVLFGGVDLTPDVLKQLK